jgi:DUF4097 and DUF4098 domain-containing protein YvlB
MSGDVMTSGPLGDVDVESVSGNVQIDAAADVDVQAVNGDVSVAQANGKVHLEIVSGNGDIVSTAAAPDVSFESTSGDIRWKGVCGKGCLLHADSYSGNVQLDLDKKSSFALSYSSNNGSVDDQLGLAGRNDKQSVTGMTHIKGSYGKGDGSVEIRAYSGDLALVKH